MNKIKTNSKINTFIGFAARTRGLVSGADCCEDAIKNGKVKLLFLSGDASEATVERFEFLSSSRGVTCLMFEDDSIGSLIGKPERKIVGITDKRFTQAILNELNLGDKK